MPGLTLTLQQDSDARGLGRVLRRTVTPLGHVTSAAHPARPGSSGGSLTSRKVALGVRRDFRWMTIAVRSIRSERSFMVGDRRLPLRRRVRAAPIEPSLQCLQLQTVLLSKAGLGLTTGPEARNQTLSLLGCRTHAASLPELNGTRQMRSP